MSMFKKVVIPLDGSKLAEEAIWAAEPHLRQAGEVVLVTTIDPSVNRAFSDFATAERISVYEAVERYLSDMVTRLEGEGITVRSRYIADSIASEGVLQVARSEEPTLIVMSSHGRTGLTRLMMGSVAGRVLRGAPCPVLIVPSS